MAEETDGVQFSNKASETGENNNLLDHPIVKHHATKKVPHYLRASTGSCHDACKYGHPHKIKDKTMRPLRKKMSTPLPDGEKMVDIQIYVDKKVQKAMQSNKVELPSVQESASADEKSKKSFTSTWKSPVLDSSSKLVKHEGRSFTKSVCPKVPKMISNKVVQSSRKSTFPDASKILKQEVTKKNVLPKRIPLNPKEKNALEGDTNGRGWVKQSLLLDTLKRSNRDVASTTTIKEVSLNRTPLNSKARNVSESILKPSSSPRISKVETKKLLHPTTAGDASKSLKVRQKPRSQAEAKEPCSNKKVEERTMHVIETKLDDPSIIPNNVGLLIQSPSPLSPESLNSSSQTNSLSFNSHEAEDQCDLDSEYTDISSAESKAAIVNHEFEGPMKLKFSKGNAVEHQSESETNRLRMLQFRQGRVLDDDDNQGANGGAQRLDYSKISIDNIKREAETGVVKVVLKHQEMEAKKDEQVSLNYVIEETASKLVEKRKSRVKALVGAFESVISLQERKPCAADR